MFPWSYDIPHEDVIFASNQSSIPSEEVYKLTDVQQEDQGGGKVQQFAIVNLYVAGYTDTVGDAGHNLQLSTNRARSIGTWFKKMASKATFIIKDLERVSLLSQPQMALMRHLTDVCFMSLPPRHLSHKGLSQTHSGSPFHNLTLLIQQWLNGREQSMLYGFKICPFF